jgi:hypothetical protein
MNYQIEHLILCKYLIHSGKSNNIFCLWSSNAYLLSPWHYGPENFGLLYNRCPFFSIILPWSLHIQLSCVILYVFHLSQSEASHFLLPLGLLWKIFLAMLLWSILVKFINDFTLVLLTTISEVLHNFLNLWLVITLYTSCTVTVYGVFFKIYFSQISLTCTKCVCVSHYVSSTYFHLYLQNLAWW